MLVARIIFFLLTISPSISLYSMGVPDAQDELQQLIQLRNAMQQRIKILEEQKVQEEKLIELRSQELFDAKRQNKRTRKQLLQLSEAGIWKVLTHGLDHIATIAYFQVLPPVKNPSDDRQLLDSSFFVAKSLILQPCLMKALYYNLHKPKKKALPASNPLEQKLSTADLKTTTQSDWYIPGMCRFYSDVFFKRDFGGPDYKDDSLVTDIGARAIGFTIGTMLLPVAVAYDSAKVIGNSYSTAKSYFIPSLESSHD